MKTKKTAPLPSACTVCFEDFKKYRKPVDCPACPSDKPPSVCKECTKDYLLGSPKDAHCMQCNHAWGYQFLFDAFDETFLTKTYRQSRQVKALEREKGLLQQTMPLVAQEKARKEAAGELQELKKEMAELKAEYSAKFHNLTARIREKQRGVRPGAKDEKSAGVQYLFPCPVMVDEETEEQCRGFIEKKSWRCGLCETKVCQKCHCVNEENQKNKHKCKKDDVETAKMVMADTKPCPKCKARIFKIVGCDQMFCTACHTPFSWESGEIVTGVIHNPHYYELLKKTGIAPAPRNAGDAPCGGIPWMDEFIAHIAQCSDEVRELFNNTHRRCAEIQGYIAHERHKQANLRECEDIRLRWLLGEFKNEKAWQKSIFIRERNINKKREELAILDTFVTAAAERFRNLGAECVEIDNAKLKVALRNKQKLAVVLEFLKDLNKIREFCNHAFETNYKALAYKQWPQIDFTIQFGKKSMSRRTEMTAQEEEEEM